MSVPRLHLVTSTELLEAPGFEGTAGAILEAHGRRVLLQLRGHATPGRRLYELAASLSAGAEPAGPVVLVNDRLDIARALGLGAQVGARSIPVARARALVGDRLLGYSAHGADEAASAATDADFVVVGTIWSSASHPERPPAGLALLRDAVAAAPAPVLAIGGVTPERAAEALEAGAHGVAVLGGVWHQPDPVAAVERYLTEMERSARRGV